MARIQFGLSPWARYGTIGGGLAEGAYMGGQLVNQARRTKAEEEAAKQYGTHNALMALAQAAKSEDPATQEWLTKMIQQSYPQLAGVAPPPGMSLEQKTEKQLAAETQAKVNVAKNILKIPEGTPEYEAFVYGKQLKEPKEMVDWTLPDGRNVKITSQQAATLAQQEALKQLTIAARGAGHGGRGGKEFFWQDKDTGAYLGRGPTQPTPNAVPATAGSFRQPSEETPQPLPWVDTERLAKIEQKLKKGEALEPGEEEFYTMHGGKHVEFPSASMVQSPAYTKLPKKKKLPVKPPPGAEDEEYNYVNK